MSQHSAVFNPHKRHAIYERDGYKCWYCGHHDPTKSGSGLSLDHINPMSGISIPIMANNKKDHQSNNLITACGPCNSIKQDKPYNDFIRYQVSSGRHVTKEAAEAQISSGTLARQVFKPIDLAKGKQLYEAAKAFRKQQGQPINESGQVPAQTPTVDKAGPAKPGGSTPAPTKQTPQTSKKPQPIRRTTPKPLPVKPISDVRPPPRGDWKSSPKTSPKAPLGTPSSSPSTKAPGTTKAPPRGTWRSGSKKPDKNGPGIKHDPHSGQFMPGHKMRASMALGMGTRRFDIHERGRYYQGLLRLMDWRIKFFLVPNLKTPRGHKAYGLCDPVVDNKTATIWIRDPSTPVDDGCDPYQKAEEAIVHELSHLHFAPFGTRSPAEIAAEEQAVWAFAEAIAGARGTDRAEYASRAMLARIRSRAARAAKGRHGMDMDMSMLIAALEAALEAEDPKAAIQALLEKVKGLLGDAEPGPPEDLPEMHDGDPKPGEVMSALAAMKAQIAALSSGSRAALAPASGVPNDLLEIRRERVRAMAERHPGLVSPEAERRYIASGDADGFSTLIGEVRRHALAPARVQRSGARAPDVEETEAGAGLSDFERFQAQQGGISDEKFAAAKKRQSANVRKKGS